MAYIERYGDPSTRIYLPRLTGSDFTRDGEGTFVQFAGRALPVGARAQRPPPRRWSLETTLAKTEHEIAHDLDFLFTSCFFSQSESRLTFVPNEKEDNAVNPYTVGEVHDWQFNREPGGIVRLSFDFQEVEG